MTAIPPKGALTGLRASVALMNYPFLSLGPRHNRIHFQGFAGKRPFFLNVVSNNPELGMATLADGDVLIYALTQLSNRFNLSEPLAPPIVARSSSILRALGRPRGGHQHALLAKSMARLAATEVSTNISGIFEHFTLLDAQAQLEDAQDGLWSIASSFLVHEIASRRVLQFDRAALALHGLERRLYEWARVRAGGNQYSSWTITLDRARDRAGSQDIPRRFRHAIRCIVERDRLPGFTLALEDLAGGPSLVITRSDNADAQPDPRPMPILDIGLAALDATVSAEPDDLSSPFILDLSLNASEVAPPFSGHSPD